MAERLKNVTLENARILFRNFSGREGQFNREGDRNFCVILDHEEAAILDREGWNIKTLQPREEGDLPQPYMHVKVHFGKRPPRIVLITSRGKTDLDESTVSLLDWAEIRQVDLIVRPYTWDVAGKTGIKAYLQSIYVTIEEDPLEMKYVDVPDSAANSLVPPNFEDDEE